ncbi:MAG: hypothetical protein ACE5R6_07540 [Candidatus Heimdallarchaeota archaeon]
MSRSMFPVPPIPIEKKLIEQKHVSCPSDTNRTVQEQKDQQTYLPL